MDNKFIKLFADCFITKGFSRSSISMAQGATVFTVPNSLIECLDNLKTKSIGDFKATLVYGDELDILNEYLEFLLGNNLGFFCDDLLS